MGRLLALFARAVGPMTGDSANSDRRRSMVRCSWCNANRLEFVLTSSEELVPVFAIEAERINVERRELMSVLSVHP